MVRLLNDLEAATMNLVARLFRESANSRVCPNIKRDSTGPYCARDMEPGEEITEQRRMLCDHLSLQLWCLTKDRYKKCIWYQGEKF